MFIQNNNFDGINRKNKRNKTSFTQKLLVYVGVYVVVLAALYISIVGFVSISTSNFEKYCEINKGRQDINCLFSKNY